MRILTANLRAGLADPEALAELLEASAIDVACFQELGPTHVDAVRHVLPHGVLDPGSGRRRFSGMGIAAREPLHVEVLPLEGRRGFRALLDESVELLNVHVMVYASRTTPHAGILRRRQVRQLLDHLDATPEQPRLLLGDLNSWAVTPAYRSLTSRLRDLHVEYAATSGGAVAPTWGWRPTSRRLLRLDHVLGAGVDVARVEVVDLVGSDHDGLIVEL